MKIKPISLALLLAFFLALVAYPVLAQDTYQLNVQRTFGYGNGNQIRGNFRLSVAGPANTTLVTFLMDGVAMGQATAQPFAFSFNTDQYPTGSHTLSASITTADGQTFTTPGREFLFVTAEQESASMKGFLIPLFGGILGIIVLVVGAQFLFFRKRNKTDLAPGASRNYGITGGAICPRCHRPFALGFLAMNVGITSKLTRCPYCGRWGVFKREGMDKLREAEAAELAAAQPEQAVQEKTEAEKLKEILDNSRFTDKM